MNKDPTPYATLTPELILDAVDKLGFVTDGRLLALNSYENRVYQIGLETQPPIIVKFYRPERWSDESILDEHRFIKQLHALEIPAVAPLEPEQGQTLYRFKGFRYTLFPRASGHAPELDNEEHLRWLGRFLGRIHEAGRQLPLEHRPVLNFEQFGFNNMNYLIDHQFIPDYLGPAYESVAKEALTLASDFFKPFANSSALTLHGDCHPGNILWSQEGPVFVDFDDCLRGPVMQDIWMLLSGSPNEMLRQLDVLMEGYTLFSTFDHRQVQLIEPLRTLRLVHYSAWIAKRWHDPAFPLAFPWFNQGQYWESHINALREQVGIMQEPFIDL